MPHAVREALHRAEPAVDVRVMGERGTPPLKIEDPNLLAWLEREGWILLIWSATEAEEWQDRLIYLPMVSR